MKTVRPLYSTGLPVLLLGLLIASGSALAEMPLISDARIVQPPPGAKVAAGYFTVTNEADEPLVITRASSDTISKVELHLSFVENDVARMQEQESITVPAGESLEFRQGSYHLMMMGLTEPLRAGNTVNVTLETSAGPLPVALPIITPDQASAMPGLKHDTMQGMNSMQHDMSEQGMAEHGMDADKKENQ